MGIERGIHHKHKTRASIIQFLLEMLCIAILAFIMAGLFVDALDQHFEAESRKQSARMHQMIERGF